MDHHEPIKPIISDQIMKVCSWIFGDQQLFVTLFTTIFSCWIYPIDILKSVDQLIKPNLFQIRGSFTNLYYECANLRDDTQTSTRIGPPTTDGSIATGVEWKVPYGAKCKN